MLMYILAISFQSFKEEVTAAFEAYIQDICNCTVTLTNANLVCTNASSGFYTVQFLDQSLLISTFVYELLKIATMNNGIDLGVAVIRMWPVKVDNSPTDDSDDVSFNWHHILRSLYALVIVSVVLMFFLILVLILFTFCTCVYCK